MTNEEKQSLEGLTIEDVRTALKNNYFDGEVTEKKHEEALTFLTEVAIFNVEHLKNQ